MGTAGAVWQPQVVTGLTRVPEALQRPRWVPRAAGLATLLIGLMDILSALTRGLRERIEALTSVLPGAVTDAAAAATVIVGVLLVLLAHALRRRKRRAWRAAVVLLGLSVVLHVVKGLDVEEAGISLALLVVLVVARREFTALGDPRTRWRALWVFVLLLAVDLVVGLLLLVLRRHAIVGHPGWGAAVLHVLLGLVGIPGPVTFHRARADELVSFVLLALGALTVVAPAWLFLRPEEPPGRQGPDDEARLRQLLDRHGHRDSLGYFALRRDKSVCWSPSGKAAVTYRVVSGVMLASGDPLGDPEAWPQAISVFLQTAARHAWTPAVMGCSETAGEVWCREGGLAALEIGDEAIVETAGFSLEGRAMRNVRQMVTRVRRNGYSTTVRRLADIPLPERAAISEQAARWRNGETERGFSMALGRIGDPNDDACVLVTAAKDGVVRAFLHFVPWGRDGLSLDLMRRDRAAEAGLNELLIVASLEAAADLGIRRVSLNFAVFRSALERGERLGAGPVLRMWRRLLVFLSRWFQIESLYRFNAKFQPQWYPRFLVYPSGGDLPRIALAVMEAEAFVTLPHPFDVDLRAVREARRQTAGAA
ncbi:MAG: phosphatidylglycerol lysyltransferase domain-containing protein [Actinomycetes bacterium]